jgi:hypothetical protein
MGYMGKSTYGPRQTMFIMENRKCLVTIDGISPYRILTKSMVYMGKFIYS